MERAHVKNRSRFILVQPMWQLWKEQIKENAGQDVDKTRPIYAAY